MRRKPYGWLVILVGAGLLAGCDMGSDSGNKGRTKLVAPGMAPLEPVDSGPKQPPSQRKPPPVGRPAPSPAQGPVVNAASTPPPGPGMVRIRVEPGIGKKGRYEGEGFLVTPLKAYYHTREYAELKIKLPTTLNIYANDPALGLPKTAEEFMKMCKDNDISLPELPPGESYVWDPVEGELYLQKPR